MTKKMATPHDRCFSYFVTLSIPLSPESLDTLLAKAEKESLSRLSFVDQFIGEQADACHERAVQRRILEARFAEKQILENFDWKFTTVRL